KAARVAFQRCELVTLQQIGLVKQAADQRRLAVIDGAAGEQSEDRSIGRCRCADPAVRHQKYPWRFLRSIEAAWSLSMSRPSRSEARERRNSATICGTLAAAEGIAPVNG